MAKIEMGKKYKTGDGRAVRILCVDMNNAYPVVAIVTEENGDEDTWGYTAEGQYNTFGPDEEEDLVEVTPFTDLKIDDLIWVKSPGSWVPRHYAGNNGVKVYAWNDGRTSHSAPSKLSYNLWGEFSRTNPNVDDTF